MIKTIIFDFDGVILDTSDIKTAAFTRVFENHTDHLNAIIQHHKQNMGISRYKKFQYIYQNIFREKLSSEKERELGEKFESYALNAVLTASFIAGSREFLEKEHHNYNLFVASGTPENELKKIVEIRNLKSYFKEVHGSPRSKPDIILELINRFRLKLEEILFVGDAESDRIAAEATGVQFIGCGNDDVFSKKVRVIPNLINLKEILIEKEV